MKSDYNVFYLPGLGADERLFKDFYQDLPPRSFEYPKFSKTDNLKSYASKCIANWGLKQNTILIGFSFGGMLGKEILNQLDNTSKLFMISSVRTSDALDSNFILFSQYLLFLPDFILRFLLVWLGPHFASRGDSKLKKEDIALLRDMARSYDLRFFKWSLGVCRNWANNIDLNLNITQIHGEKDLIVPDSNNDADITIKNAHHLICFTHSEKLLNIIKKRISNEYS